MKWVVFILLFLPPLLSHAEVVKAEETRVLYRVLLTTPDEFISAMRTPAAPQTRTQTHEGKFEKFFEIKNRIVTGKTVAFQVGLKARFLPDIAAKMTSGQVTMTELVAVENNRRFAVHFELSQASTVDAILTILPDKVGSLLRLQIQKSSIPDWILDRTIRAAIQLNLANAQER